MKPITHIIVAAFAMALPAVAQDSLRVDERPDAVVATTAAATAADEPAGGRKTRAKLAHEILAERPDGLGGLHEGLNVEVGFSVSAGLGKNRVKGAGFGEHIAAVYAMPFSKDKRWWGSFGVYGDRLDWGSYNRVEGGIEGMLGYRVNDRINLYVYGAYNFIPGRENGLNPYFGSLPYGYCPYGYSAGCLPYGYGGYAYSPYGYGYGGYGPCGYGYGGYGPYGYGPYGNLRGRIGAAAEFKIGESGHLVISVEHSSYDGRGPWGGSPLPVPPQGVGSPGNKGARPFNISDNPSVSSRQIDGRNEGRGSNARR